MAKYCRGTSALRFGDGGVEKLLLSAFDVEMGGESTSAPVGIAASLDEGLD